ncbi:hypothetical protein [Halorussus caseinilyticus]|uniref:Flagellin n=1 Tax=Halorussus caseinilyticus TaxID=3034025 RepID=A0ABD5WMF1_9EURY
MIALVFSATTGGVLVGTGVLQQSPERDFGRDGDHAGVAHAKIVGGSANVTANGTVDYVNLTVAHGTTDVDFSAVTITWLGPDRRVTLVYRDAPTADADAPKRVDRFTVVPIRDPDTSAPLLTESDRFELVMDVTSIRKRPLTSDQSVELRLLTGDGIVRVYRLTIPSSLGERGAVAV